MNFLLPYKHIIIHTIFYSFILNFAVNNLVNREPYFGDYFIKYYPTIIFYTFGMCVGVGELTYMSFYLYKLSLKHLKEMIIT